MIEGNVNILGLSVFHRIANQFANHAVKHNLNIVVWSVVIQLIGEVYFNGFGGVNFLNKVV